MRVPALVRGRRRRVRPVRRSTGISAPPGSRTFPGRWGMSGTRSVRAMVRKRGGGRAHPPFSCWSPPRFLRHGNRCPTPIRSNRVPPPPPAYHVPHDRAVQFASHFGDTPSVRAGKQGADHGYVRRPPRTGNAPDRPVIPAGVRIAQPPASDDRVRNRRRHIRATAANGIGPRVAEASRQPFPTPGTGRTCRTATGSECDVGFRASSLPETPIRQKTRNGNRTGVPAGNGPPPRLPGRVPRAMVPARECPAGDWTGASPPHAAAGHRAAAIRPQVDACAGPGAAIVGAAAPERRKADIAHRIPGVAPGPPVRRRCAPITRRPRAASGISPPRLESRVKAHEDPIKGHNGNCCPRMPPLAFAPVSAHIAECPWL